MHIFLVRHGKSDKSLQDSLTHAEFEQQRPLVAGEDAKAFELGVRLAALIPDLKQVDLVHSGRVRAKQTLEVIGEGMGVNVAESAREDFGLSYVASEEYWRACKAAVGSGAAESHADYFLAHEPNDDVTFSADSIRQNMRGVLRRAVERDTFMGIDTAILVSHEPVISLCLSDLAGKSVSDLGGECHELEYAHFEITTNGTGRLMYRDESYQIDVF